jgi:hypothetical protein
MHIKGRSKWLVAQAARGSGEKSGPSSFKGTFQATARNPLRLLADALGPAHSFPAE